MLWARWRKVDGTWRIVPEMLGVWWPPLILIGSVQKGLERGLCVWSSNHYLCRFWIDVFTDCWPQKKPPEAAYNISGSFCRFLNHTSLACPTAHLTLRLRYLNLSQKEGGSSHNTWFQSCSKQKRQLLLILKEPIWLMMTTTANHLGSRGN